MTTERVRIEGMGCDHCIKAVREALEKLDVNIHSVDIGYAEISYGSAVDRAMIDAAITEAGYQPIAHETAA